MSRDSKHSSIGEEAREPRERAYQALGDLVRASSAEACRRQADEQRQAFERGFVRLHTRRRRVWPWLALPSAAAACALTLFWAFGDEPRERALSVVEEGDGGEVRVGAPLLSRSRLRFSEGTVAQVGEGSRAVISHLDARGGTLTLNEGRLSLKVMKRPRAAWRVEAGPYLVEVTGTAFDVRWRPRTGEFRIDLHTGSVRVSGPGLAARTPLQAGHALFVEDGAPTIAALAAPPLPRPPAAALDVAPVGVRAGATTSAGQPEPSGQPGRHPLRSIVGAAPPTARARVTEPREAPGGVVVAPAPVAAVDSTLAPPPLAPPPLQPAPPARAASPSTWEQRLAAGAFDAVVQDAELQGLDEVLSTRSLHDLKALADASRYTRRTQVAERALKALRARFADSAAAQSAAFELGRLEDDANHAPARAADWYAQYLSEAPAGPLAQEALLRFIVAREKQGERAQALAAARRYLQVHPDGPGASLARKLLNEESPKP